MEMEIITRHFTLGEDQREAVTEAFGKLERFAPRPIQSLKLTFSHEAGRFQADAVLHLGHHDFRADAEAMEPEYAAAELAESLRKQLHRFKGKMSGKQKGEEGGLGRAMFADGGVFAGEEAPAEGFVLKDMGVDEAKAAFADTDLPFLIFREVVTARLGVIYKREDGELGHLEAQEG